MSTDEQEAAADEETEFVVVLLDAGVKKTDITKAVREMTGLGLKEAMELVSGAPKAVIIVKSKEDAEARKKELEDAGAKAEINQL